MIPFYLLDLDVVLVVFLVLELCLLEQTFIQEPIIFYQHLLYSLVHFIFFGVLDPPLPLYFPEFFLPLIAISF